MKNRSESADTQLEFVDPVMITVEFHADRSRPRDEALPEIARGLLAAMPSIVDMLYPAAS